MKNNLLLTLCLILFSTASWSQAPAVKAKAAVIHIDSKGFDIDPEQMGNMTRMELIKLEHFQVMDRYDMAYLIDQNQLDASGCFGRLCMVELGKSLQAEKMLTGSIERYGKAIVINFQLIDVASEIIEQSKVLEFVDLSAQLPRMIGLTLQKMLGEEVDQDLFNKLTQPYDFESSINTPEASRLNLSGPRMGLIFLTGESAKVYKAPKQAGGFDSRPMMFQFGYQFEVKYLNEGNFQALFEFIPLISGVDQGFFIPSFTLLNGLRSNKKGWEFAFGPTFSVAQVATGFYDENNEWIRSQDWRNTRPGEAIPFPEEERLDSRGNYKFTTGFVIAAGRTFRSGRLNIPVNLFFIPGKGNTHRLGISMGFNAKQ